MNQWQDIGPNNGQVDQLEQELKEAIMRQVILEWELEQLLDSGNVSYQDRTAGIHSLSIEVLTQILYEVLLLPDGGPIGRLMRVCKLWQEAILNTPRLWSIIRINVPSSLEKLDVCLAHCQTSIARSGSCLLDIWLSFPFVAFGDWSFTSPSGRIAFLQERDDWSYSLWHWALYGGLPNRLDCPYPYRARRRRIFHSFIGRDGDIMVRWRSFECDENCRGHGPVTKVFGSSALSHPTPFLETLVFNDLTPRESRRSPYSGDWIYPFELPTKDGWPTNFPSMPNIRTLRLPDMETPIHKQGMNPSLIRDLECTCRNHDSLRFILALQNLTHLQLAFSNRGGLIGPRLGNNPIFLPHLQSLRIAQSVIRPLWTLLDAPKLESIFLDDLIEDLHPSVPVPIGYTFPSLSAMTIHHRWGKFSHHYLRFVHDLVSRTPSLVSIKCDQQSQLIESLKRYQDGSAQSSSSDRRSLGQRIDDGPGTSSSTLTLDILALVQS
ncbi:hypothetical protein CPB86DRAFT_824423 [Serendipita vermifera]|nr:hypothetical protein CPB86DRAFT_824423 [Serendipita vermifera]